MDRWFVQAGYFNYDTGETEWVSVGPDNREVRDRSAARTFQSSAEGEAWTKSSEAKAWMPCSFRVLLLGEPATL